MSERDELIACRERLRIATDALEYIVLRKYTGASYVADDALIQMSVVEED